MEIRAAEAADRVAIEGILDSSQRFRSDEIESALNQLDHSLSGDPTYSAFVASMSGAIVAFLTIGPTPKCAGVFDLYWLAVARERWGGGIGSRLIRFAEDWTRERGGNTVLIETAAGQTFSDSRAFYVHCGYHEESRLKDFRRLQEDRIIYAKTL